MRSLILVALAAIAMLPGNAQAASNCQEDDQFNAEYGGPAKCKETAAGLDYTFVKGTCAKDQCFVFGLNQCTQAGCADLMGSWDCPTKAQCDAALASPDHVKGAGAPTCTFFEQASDPQKRDGYECSDGTWCVNGFDDKGFNCNMCEVYGQTSTQASCQQPQIALQAEAPQEVDDSANYSGAIIGTSVAVLGAAAAIFAARRCNKKDNDFER